MLTIQNRTQLPDMQDLFVTMRDLATSLAGNPFHGDVITQRAMRDLCEAAREIELGEEQCRKFLGARVLELCLDASGCVKRAAAEEHGDQPKPREEREDEYDDYDDYDEYDDYEQNEEQPPTERSPS